MKYDPEKHHRRSIRLKGYDYSQPGGYYVTIVTHNRECLFGSVSDGEMVLNDAGKMVEKIWKEIPKFYSNFSIDTFQIMPNHLHGILTIVGADPRVCPNPHVCPNDIPRACPDDKQNRQLGQPQGIAPTLSLGDVIKRFKTLTTKLYIDCIKQNKWRPFNGKLWQRNYWEHIIRNEKDLTQIREYIINNPVQWELDNENPNKY
ncbi:transposase [Candidatus Latescibacterota bacterium]